MSGTAVARQVLRAGAFAAPLPQGTPTVTLDHDSRFLRRKRLETDAGWGFLVDLTQTTSLDDGDVLVLTDGAQVRVAAAPEALLEVTGHDLVRLAWHIGNRHCPCQIEPERLFIKRDAVLARMLEHLGASVREVTAPFLPEGGAYGHGRTHGHDHGHIHVPADAATHAHTHHSSDGDGGSSGTA